MADNVTLGTLSNGGTLGCDHHFHITQEARMTSVPWPHRWCCKCGHTENASRYPVLELPPHKQYYLASCGQWREVKYRGVINLDEKGSRNW